MIELFFAVIVLILYILYRIYRFAMRQSRKEEEYWGTRKDVINDFPCKIYNAFKVILLLIAIGAGLFIFVSLANGHTPTMRDLSSEKFRYVLLGVGMLAFFQAVPIAIYAFFKKHGRLKPGTLSTIKVLLFFALIIAIAAVLLFGIYKAAY